MRLISYCVVVWHRCELAGDVIVTLECIVVFIWHVSKFVMVGNAVVILDWDAVGIGCGCKLAGDDEILHDCIAAIVWGICMWSWQRMVWVDLIELHWFLGADARQLMMLWWHMIGLRWLFDVFANGHAWDWCGYTWLDCIGHWVCSQLVMAGNSTVVLDWITVAIWHGWKLAGDVMIRLDCSGHLVQLQLDVAGNGVEGCWVGQQWPTRWVKIWGVPGKWIATANEADLNFWCHWMLGRTMMANNTGHDLLLLSLKKPTIHNIHTTIVSIFLR